MVLEAKSFERNRIKVMRKKTKQLKVTQNACVRDVQIVSCVGLIFKSAFKTKYIERATKECWQRAEELR